MAEISLIAEEENNNSGEPVEDTEENYINGRRDMSIEQMLESEKK